jgi:hypothetical protein
MKLRALALLTVVPAAVQIAGCIGDVPDDPVTSDAGGDSAADVFVPSDGSLDASHDALVEGSLDASHDAQSDGSLDAHDASDSADAPTSADASDSSDSSDAPDVQQPVDCGDPEGGILRLDCGGSVGIVCGTACPTTTYPEVDWLQQFAAQYTYNGLTGFAALGAENDAWHTAHTPSSATYGADLIAFIHAFVRKYDDWRAAKGIVPIPIWNPGTPIPDETPHAGRSTNDPQVGRPEYLQWWGASNVVVFKVAGSTYKKLEDFVDIETLGRAIANGWIDDIAKAVGGDMTTASSAPSDPAFWRLQKFVDTISIEWKARNSQANQNAIVPQSNQMVLWSEGDMWHHASILSVGEYPRQQLVSLNEHYGSSCALGPNVRADLYSSPFYDGFHFATEVTVKSFAGIAINDNSSSFRVRYRLNCPPPSPDQVILYADQGFAGACSVLNSVANPVVNNGDYPDADAMGMTTGSISSIRVGAHVKAVLYFSEGLKGASMEAGADYALLGSANDDKTASVKVLPR